MSDKNLKAIRGQVRQITKELLTSELVAASNKEVAAVVNKRLDAIDAYIKEQLKQLADKTEEMQSYVVRHITHANVNATPTVDTSAPKTS